MLLTVILVSAFVVVHFTFLIGISFLLIRTFERVRALEAAFDQMAESVDTSTTELRRRLLNNGLEDLPQTPTYDPRFRG